MEIPTSYGSLDAGKLMRIWGRVTRSEHISDDDPIGRLATVGSRVYTNADAASYKCVVNFSEPGEVEYDDWSNNAVFFAVAYEVIPRMVAALVNGLADSVSLVQMRTMAEKVDDIPGLFDRYASHDPDCLASLKKEKDQWTSDAKCSCGRDKVRGVLNDMCVEFREAANTICEAIEVKMSSSG